MNPKSTKPTGLSTLKLALALGINRLTLDKWIAEDGLKPIRVQKSWKFYDLDAAKKLFAPRLLALRERADTTDAAVDPESGLSWAQSEKKERAITAKLKNEEKQRALDEQWMRTDEHLNVVALIAGNLEALPLKARSELGLNETQATGLRRMVDNLRRDMVAELGKRDGNGKEMNRK